MSTAEKGQILRHDADNVVTLSLSHPGKLNALSINMWHSLCGHMQQINQDMSIRAVIVQGMDGNFAAGADISEFPAQRHDLESVMHYHRRILAPALHALAACPHPLIAKIEGVCVGGGLEIAAQCDMRIASRNARFGAPINKLGFPMAPEEMIGLLRLAGLAVASEILLEGRILTAQQAWEKGLLTRLVDVEQLAAEVNQSVQRIKQGSARAARLNKRMLRRLSPVPVALSQAEYRDFFAYAPTHDHQEGVRAFLAGEEPVFIGD
ncbi:enoyl-CoA hydratase/isomerase family protein [Alcaligenes endophyticus]|uniref:Enoyl-CoA hydratase/isomerase family protein n=1 Tax=Alcaligenes endophyticus TaxID=1929088 RepID=A0ABT8EHD5_9BURK|nr:enoyl-CoA hydratase/isomerase family protein [Alcaligenes endophyticus]MCX5589658.1 enoyl-CoA hydratase/isomerase family protein [Alcaligenes endophyticus]MDN4120678.1 enoyl-CoA hydratase/isomerase family protein [Alcaligenes endophyticus]